MIFPKKFPFIVGVAGGSGSGKTTFARALQKHLGPERCEIIFQDNFYIDQSHRFDRDGGSVNFDHPDAIEFEAIAKSLLQLRSHSSVQIPIYDFATHKRIPKTLQIHAVPLIVVDGILILHSEKVRKCFDYSLFFETPEELRFQRRLERDVRERGRTLEGVREQFYRQVKPMHDLFVEPSKTFANAVVREGDSIEKWIAEVSECIEIV